VFEPRLIGHRGRRILRLDFVGLSEPELLAAFDEAQQVVRGAPFRSLRVLAYYGSALTTRAAAALKPIMAGNQPHVRACAVVGSNVCNMVPDLQAHGREDVTLFEDEASALDWLASQ
jgi:hypothetical protein